LADVANQKIIREQAETLLENIRGDIKPHRNDPGSIVATGSELTRRYANNPRRKSGFTVDTIYKRIIPFLIRNGEAMLLSKVRKKEIYAFGAE
jgi:hypothetical protein